MPSDIPLPSVDPFRGEVHKQNEALVAQVFGSIPLPDCVAQALNHAGVGVITHVPGFGASPCFDACGALMGPRAISFHEEVAFTIAHGSALAGMRAATLLKPHGLAKAANSLVDALACGVTAGLVVLAFDDREGQHSDGIFDVAGLLQSLRLPIEALYPVNTYEAVLSAFERSERWGLPVAVIVDSAEITRRESYQSRSLPPPVRGWQRDPGRQLVCPLFAYYQQQVLDAKLAGQDPQTIPRPPVPVIPDGLPAEWRGLIQGYQPLFEAFKTTRREWTTGDTGLSALFALPPFDCVDLCTYMGGSIPLAIGGLLAGRQRVWAVTGDFAFVAAGHLGLLEVVNRWLPLKVLIVQNGISQATGGQRVPADLLAHALAGYESQVIRIRSDGDAAHVRSVLRRVADTDAFQIVVADVG